MSIISLQRRIAEAGRIRIGQQVPSGQRTRPSKLDTFRLTSADKLRIEQAAAQYGGTVAEWAAPAGPQWEVVTKADALDVIVPPSDLSFSQNYELWSAGGCLRRCDGVDESLSGGPCLCSPDDRECDIHTRLSVMLRDLPGLGVWRLDTQGYYAAVELASAMDILALAAGRGALLPARLRLEQRSAKRPDGKGKIVTLRYAVPVLDIEVSPATLLSGGVAPVSLLNGESGMSSAEPRPRITPVPALAFTPSVAEQAERPQERPRRANAASEIPASGRQRSARAAAPTQVIEEPPEVAASGSVADAVSVHLDAAPARPRRATGDEVTVSADTPPAEPAVVRDVEYWMKRVHAQARERGLDHAAVRAITGATLGIAAADLEAFSSSDVVPVEWEAVSKLIAGLPDDLGPDSAVDDGDAISIWVWPRANAKGLDSWETIDVVATAATGKQPDALTVGEWIAWTVRLVAGEYDA